MNLWLLTIVTFTILAVFWRVLMWTLDQIAGALEQMSAPTEPRTTGAKPASGEDR